MKTKKWLILGCMACVGTILFASCGTCEHSYGEWETKVAPTCTAFGYDVRVCSECGEEETKIVEAIGHSYANNEQSTVLHEPTCVDDGLILHSCSVCGEQELQISTKTGTHIYEEGMCKFCGIPQSQGLEYEMSEGFYIVKGVGSCTDSHIYVPRIYKGIPVYYINIENWETAEHVTDITLHKDMTDAFDGNSTGCPNLQNIYVSEENESYSSENGILYTRDKKTLVKYPEGRGGAFVVPDTVQRLGYGAFYNCSSLTEIVIPDSVTFGDDVFYNCSSLTEIVIPDSVTLIGDDTFYGCSSLTKVYYRGTAGAWANIQMADSGNEKLTSAVRYYYIENQADVPTDGGNYWHYDTDGKTVLIWE